MLEGTICRRLRDLGVTLCIALPGLSGALVAETVVQGNLGTTTWTEAESPYRVTATVVVSAGATLTIEPGVVVGFDPGTSLAVRGSLVADGTAEKSVRFGPRQAGETWGGVVLLDADARGSLTHLELSHATTASLGATTYKAAFDIMDGPKVQLLQCWFHDFDGVVIYSAGGSELLLLDSLIENCHEGLNSVRSYARVEGTTVRNVTGYSDCIDFDYESTPQSVIRDCLLENNAEDDGIDLGGSSALVENVEIRGVKTGKAISIDLVSSPVIRNVVVHDCMWGLVVKDKATAFFDHCTVNRCDIGFYCFNKVAGAGGGHGSGDSLILWGNLENTKVGDALSSLVLTNTLVGGGYAGAGNIDADPLFVDAEARDYHLQPGSPAIGTGKDGTDMGAFPFEGVRPVLFVRGEASGDGDLNIGDAVTILLFLFSGTVDPTCLDALDADDSGDLNVTDAVSLLGYLFLGGPQPPPPFPNCGPGRASGTVLGCSEPPSGCASGG